MSPAGFRIAGLNTGTTARGIIAMQGNGKRACRTGSRLIITAVGAAIALCSLAAHADDSLRIYRHLTHHAAVVTSPTLHKAEAGAAAVWAKTGTAPTLAGSNGEVMYAYGQSHPEILCAPLHVCMVKLLPGDTGKIVLSIGDSVRWRAKAIPTGDSAVVVIKATEPNIQTNLIVSVPKTGHVYYLNLVSEKAAFVPEVGFYDPQAMIETQVIEDSRHQAEAEKQRRTVVGDLGSISPADLDFDYWWKGPQAYRPVRAFSAQGHVYIQMPASMRYGDAPALFVIDNGKEELTNYRLVGQYFVVDQLFSEAKLLLGTGDDKVVITIHAGPKPSFW